MPAPDRCTKNDTGGDHNNNPITGYPFLALRWSRLLGLKSWLFFGVRTQRYVSTPRARSAVGITRFLARSGIRSQPNVRTRLIRSGGARELPSQWLGGRDFWIGARFHIQQLFTTQLILPRDSDLNAAPLGKETGVYHFALECPSGRLIGFSRLCGKSDFQLEDGRTAAVCVKVARISTDFERFSHSRAGKVGL
jgi:hypothetical protein